MAAAVEEPPLATPLGSPVIGSCYIVAASPTGAWAGQAQKLAAYTSGGWRFIAPREGMSALVATSGVTAAFRSGAWQVGILAGSEVTVEGVKVVGVQEAAIAAPVGGTTVDSEARTAIGLILSAMRDHGLIAT